MEKRILQEGRNCWKIARASRVKFLIDGGAYFSTLADALEAARESIMILGWDFDSRVRLRPDHPDRAVASQDLGAFLNALVAPHEELNARILIWDFAAIYALDREPVPFFSPGRTHPRIHFQMDGSHPIGSSHHSKIVVIDDALAFIGGLDLAKGRWDTPAHRPAHPNRRNFEGSPLPPHHDVQMAVDGAAAAALGDLARERWWRATGERLQAPATVNDPWPSSLTPDLTDADVAIARSSPEYKGESEVREIEMLYQDAIAAAKRRIYLENPYLTSVAVGEALEKRLREARGPEIVVVLSQKSTEWLEGATMDVLRSRLLKRLRDADRFNRLSVYCPVVDGLGKGCISVHSKLLIVDDRLVRVGSANLNNRSMRLDTECDVAVEADGDPTIQQGIARLRNCLLAEHLGLNPEKITARLARKTSLIATIESLRRRRGKTLKVLDGSVPEWLDSMIPDSAIVDPESPIAPEKLIEEIVPHEERRATRGALFRGATVLLLFLGLAAAWRFTGLREWVDVETIASWQGLLRGSPVAPLWVVAAYVLGGLLVFPVTLLIVATAFAFGPWTALIYSLLGCVLSATALYGIGYVLGRETVARLTGPRLSRLNRLIENHGILAVATIRLIPVAPYSVVNLIAGAANVRLRHFVLGTLIGMSPGVAAITFLGYQLDNAIRHPGLLSFVVLGGLLSLMMLGVAWLHRRLSAESLPGKSK
ncbi:MAG: VTT domain-containing protein [Deltaproteobacteria bacterium]|nr:VTT domain-containing protein [Deltaproteobacteria bacterium]